MKNVSRSDATDKAPSRLQVKKPSDGKSPPKQASGLPSTLNPQASTKFPIVGIGASAGGLEAFTQLLNHLPLDTGLGFVLVQHLDPQHESALAQLLTRIAKHPYVAGCALESLTLSKEKQESSAPGGETPLSFRGRGRIAAKMQGGGKVSRAPPGAEAGLAGRPEEDGYNKILLLLRNHSGVDSSLYKSATIHRQSELRRAENGA